MNRRTMTRRQALGTVGLAGLATVPASAAGRRERLTITKVELFRVMPPLQEGVLAKAAGPDFDKVPKFMLKVHTDSGIVGLGETHRMGGGPEADAVVRLRRAAQWLEGRNVLDFNLGKLELPEGTDQQAFEVAFYDIIGKAIGWPVYRLLGGLGQRRSSGELLVWERADHRRTAGCGAARRGGGLQRHQDEAQLSAREGTGDLRVGVTGAEDHR